MQTPNNVKQRPEHPGDVTPCSLTWECRHHKDHEQTVECFHSVNTKLLCCTEWSLIITWAKWLMAALWGSFICHSHWEPPWSSMPWCTLTDTSLSPDIFPARSPSSSEESFLAWKWDFWEFLVLLWLCTWDRVYESARSSLDLFPLVQNWGWSSVSVRISDALSFSFFFTFGLWVALWSALLCLPEPTFLRKVIRETASSFWNTLLIN